MSTEEVAQEVERAYSALVKARGADVARLMREALEGKYGTGAPLLAVLHDVLKGEGIELPAEETPAPTTAPPEPATSKPTGRRVAVELPPGRMSEPKNEEPAAETTTARRRRAWGRRQYAKERAGKRPRINRDVYIEEGGWFPVPRIVGPEVRAAMPKNTLLAYIYACEQADPNDGSFDVSFEDVADAIGGKARSAGITAVTQLLDAGLIVREKSGKKGVATRYRLASVRDIDQTKAAQLFLRARCQAHAQGVRAEQASKARRDRRTPTNPTDVPQSMPTDVHQSHYKEEEGDSRAPSSALVHQSSSTR